MIFDKVMNYGRIYRDRLSYNNSIRLFATHSMLISLSRIADNDVDHEYIDYAHLSICLHFHIYIMKMMYDYPHTGHAHWAE